MTSSSLRINLHLCQAIIISFINLSKLKGILDAQFKNGKIVTINIDLPNEELSESSDPWIDNIGLFQDDPTFDEFLSEVNDYRNEVDKSEAHS